MKSIGSFIAGKIQRSESEDVLELAPPGAPHPELGDDEGTLVGPNGRLQFFTRGMILEGGDVIVYEDIESILLEASTEPGTQRLDIVLRGGTVKRLSASPRGALVVHATLRWIGHTRLRRDIANTTGP